MNATFVYAWTQLKGYFRDPVSLFFTLGLPLMFLVVFGMIFNNNSTVSFDVAILNHSETEFSKEFVKNMEQQETFKRAEVTSMDDARERMGRGELDTVIELPKEFGVLNEQGQPTGDVGVYYEKGSPETGQTVAQVMDSVMNQLGAQFGQQSPLFTVTRKATDTNVVSQFDYMFAGMLSFSILSMSFFGLAQMIPGWKKTGALRRLKATPLTRTQLIFGTMLNFLAIGVLAQALMFAVGILAFNFEMRGDWLHLIPFLLLGTVTLMGFGLLIGGAVKNENQAAALTNLLAFPMMFLSGIFFPSFLMPEWLQAISGIIPLTPLAEGIRYITTEGASLGDLLPQIGALSAWAVVVYAAAIKLFRWE